MSNSQEQSLSENIVFLPVNESCPEFLHCEKEREAVEMLLSAGEEAFHGAQHSSCFLSPEEVNQLASWAENYHFNPLNVENGVESCSEMKDFHSTYFPSHSDSPIPNLDLGWPVNPNCVQEGSVSVYTSPPAEGEPHVREIIRRHLQQATQVIAVVTDRLTDSAVISDLHMAASRGVPVYIILNQRSLQENFTLNRLKHPNMRVRVLGGQMFCSRTGRMVVGEMKERFLLVDSQTVIHGSYSLTWTDAHLHRQLITVLRGPAVVLFDREFRVLFAQSKPPPETRTVEAAAHATEARWLPYRSHVEKRDPVEPGFITPPSSEAKVILNWEKMGVVQRDYSLPGSPLDQHDESDAKEIPHNDNTGRAITRRFSNNWQEFGENARLEHAREKAVSRKLSRENGTNLLDRTTTRFQYKAPERSSFKKEHDSRRELLLEEKSTLDGGPNGWSKQDNMPCSRRPLIMMVPEYTSSPSDALKRIQRSSFGLFKREQLSSSLLERTQSMMDLRGPTAEATYYKGGVQMPRFQSTLDLNAMTPALTLMRKRNDDLKTTLRRTPEIFIPRARPRSSSFMLGKDWRTLPKRTEGEEE
ncbi:protein FAM83E [Xenentodon cancila]